LFKAGEYTRVFTLLQLEYSKQPFYTSLLYIYGKFGVLSSVKDFSGSAVGALEECQRGSLEERQANIQFYLGLAHWQ